MKDEMRQIAGPILLLILVFAGLLFVALRQPPDPGAAVLRISGHTNLVRLVRPRPTSFVTAMIARLPRSSDHADGAEPVRPGSPD